ncbi:MAG: PAS domain-containing sensor histidine kinase [Planctomycetota bacterium]
MPDNEAFAAGSSAGGVAAGRACVDAEIGESQRIHKEMTRLIAETKDRCVELGTGVCDLIARETGFEFVRVAQFAEFDGAGRPVHAEVFASMGGDQDVRGERYLLKESPCSEVERFCSVCVPRGVADAFPDDAYLRELSIESYAGVAVTGNDGEQIGLVYAMSTRPLIDAPAAMRRMQLIVHRFAAEVDRFYAERERERSEERYRSLVDAMPDGLVVVQGGAIVVANASASSLRGVGSSAELIGAAPGYESGQDPSGDGFEALQRLRCDGRVVVIDCSVTQVEHEGEPAVQVIERHLDDTREQERRMIRAFDLSPVAMMVVASDDRLLRMNASMREMYGLGGVEDLRGVLASLGEPHARVVDELVRRSRDGGDRHSNEVFDRSAPAGERVVMWSVHGDEFDGTVTLSAEDITSERETERLVMRGERSATTTVLSAGLVHDLGNLFSAIAAQMHTADNKLGEGHAAEDVFLDMREVLAHAEELRDSLQTLGGGHGFARRDVCVPRMLRESAGLLERLMDGTGRVLFEAEETESCVVRGDAGRLRQVLVNLVVNARDALRFERRTDGRVIVRLECANDDVSVSVTDNGPGVPEGLEEHIFEPFFTTRTRASGTGLGLAICRAIVERHGGRIGLVPSVEGEGASFRIVLPRVVASGRSISLSGVEAALAYEGGHEREIVSGLLERLGMRVVEDVRRARVVISSGEQNADYANRLVVLDPDGVRPEGAAAELRRPFGLAELERGVRRVLIATGGGEQE